MMDISLELYTPWNSMIPVKSVGPLPQSILYSMKASHMLEGKPPTFEKIHLTQDHDALNFSFYHEYITRKGEIPLYYTLFYVAVRLDQSPCYLTRYSLEQLIGSRTPFFQELS